jgi:carboxymethylenebutenolidase
MCTPPAEYDSRSVAVKGEREEALRTNDGALLREFIAEPAQGFNSGAVLIIHDIWGFSDFYRDLARRIAVRGSVGVMVDFFGRQGELPAGIRPGPEAMPQAMERAQKLSDETFIADAQRAVDDLHRRGAPKVACWGFCMGGRLAYLCAARLKGLSGVVAYYGFPGAPPDRLAPIDLAGQMRVPLLGIFGQEDKSIPESQVREFDERLKSAGKEHEFVTYPGVGHGFLRYQAGQHAQVVNDALTRTFTFLDRVLSA